MKTQVAGTRRGCSISSVCLMKVWAHQGRITPHVNQACTIQSQIAPYIQPGLGCSSGVVLYES
jgi:hypothetical protein